MAMATKLVQPHFFEASGKQVTATPHAKEAATESERKTTIITKSNGV